MLWLIFAMLSILGVVGILDSSTMIGGFIQITLISALWWRLGFVRCSSIELISRFGAKDEGEILVGIALIVTAVDRVGACQRRSAGRRWVHEVVLVEVESRAAPDVG